MSARTNQVFTHSDQLINLAKEAVFTGPWIRKTWQVFERLGITPENEGNSRFYSKAVLQQMKDIPALKRVLAIATALAKNDIGDVPFDDVRSTVRNEGLVFRPGAQAAFAKAWKTLQSQSSEFENKEHLTGRIAMMAWHATVPGVVIKNNSIKECALWAMTHIESLPWPHVEQAFGAISEAQRKSVERAHTRLVSELVPEAVGGDLCLVGKLRTVCDAYGLCRSSTPPQRLSEAIRQYRSN